MRASDLPPLDRELAQLLAKASEAHEPYLASVTSAVRDGVDRALILRGGSASDGGGGAGAGVDDAITTQNAGATSLARAAAWKTAAIAGAVGLAAGSVGGYSIGTRTATAPTAAMRVEPRAPESAIDAAAPDPIVATSATTSEAPPKPSSAPSPAPTLSGSTTARAPIPSPPIRSALRQERELVDAAGAALRAGHAAEALAAAERHAQRFPDGQLAEEREVVTIEALIALDRRDEARARGQRFHRRFPASPQRARIESLVGAP